MKTAPLAIDVLDRFVAIANTLRESGGMFDDTTMLRYAALTLPMLEGSPEQIAKLLRETAAELKKKANWWSDINGWLRYLAAASLLHHGQSAAEFLGDFKKTRALFRAAHLPRDGTCELLAMLSLREQSPDHRISAAQISRARDLYLEIRKDHRWLLGAGEYPTIALLTATDEPAAEIARRVEALLRRLEERGFGSRGRLMPISQLLFFAPGPDAAACGRFEALWKEFKAQGLKMFADDYDEVALLAFLPRTASATVRRVLEHREVIRALKPKPSRSVSFSLACATAFLELVGDDPKLRRLSRAQVALQVRSILVARQAAVIAAAS